MILDLFYPLVTTLKRRTVKNGQALISRLFLENVSTAWRTISIFCKIFFFLAFEFHFKKSHASFGAFD